MSDERRTAEFGTGEDAERLHDFLQDMGYLPRVHVAPCSCELHVRIRELLVTISDREKDVRSLQAERDDLQIEIGHYSRQLNEEKARAEKAEKERNDWERTANQVIRDKHGRPVVPCMKRLPDVQGTTVFCVRPKGHPGKHSRFWKEADQDVALHRP